MKSQIRINLRIIDHNISIIDLNNSSIDLNNTIIVINNTDMVNYGYLSIYNSELWILKYL